jgi:hypothetical protein
MKFFSNLQSVEDVEVEGRSFSSTFTVRDLIELKEVL